MAIKLLIVDDSDLIRASLQALLQGIAGIDSIRTSASLVQAFEAVRHEPPTLIVLDLHFPDGNAMRFVEPLKHLAPQAEIAILTNDASEFNRQKGLQAGAHWFFDKSTEFEKLLDLVRHQAAF